MLVVLFVDSTTHEMREELFAHGVRPRLVRYSRTIERALAKGEVVAEASRPGRSAADSTSPLHTG